MSAKILSALSDENRDLRKQMGSMNGFKFFYLNNFPARSKAQGEQHQMENPNAGRAANVSSIGSPCSSASSLTYHNRPSRVEIFPARTANSEGIAIKGKHQIWSKSMQSSDIRDVVRDSMHRETRSLNIKPRSNEDIPPVTSIMKYIDSPRPFQPALRKPETFVKNSKDERLSLPRWSFEKEVSEEIMKSKELPRLSLDSRESAMQTPLLEPTKSCASNQEHGSQLGLSSIVAKLMGLENFPDSRCKPEICSTTTKAKQNKRTSIASITPERRMQNQVSVSTPVSNNNSEVSSGLRPWMQQDYGKVTRSSKPLANNPHQTSSVYGETEKRIEEIELRYGRDLSALKEILESLQKMSREMKNQKVDCTKLTQRRHSSEDRCSSQKPNFSSWKNKRTTEQDTAVRVAHNSKSFMNEKLNLQDHKHQRKSNPPACKNKDIIPSHKNHKKINGDLSSVDKPTSRARVTSGRANPRMQLHPIRVQGECPVRTPSADFGRDKKHSSKKVAERSSRRGKKHSPSSSLQPSYDQLSQLSSETRCSSNQGDTASIKSDCNISVASQMETEETGFLANSIYTYSRELPKSLKTLAENTPSVKLATNIMEQPSPVSVLDNSFYNEDAPSPIAKISTAFQEEETTSPESGWYIDNPTHFEASLPALQRFSSENMLYPVTELSRFGSKSGETAARTNGSAYISLDPNQIYTTDATLFPAHPDQVLRSRLLTDSKNYKHLQEMGDPNTNQSHDRKIVLHTANSTLLRKTTSDEMLTSGKKSTNLQTETRRNLDDDENDGIVTEDWKDFCGEIPHLVLDVERQIFKDLINEIITGPLDSPKRTRRQLFSK